MKRFRLRDTEDHISAEGLEYGSRLAPAKSIFVVVRGMILAKDLPVAMAEVPMAFNQDMKAVVPKEAVDPTYLLYAIAARKDALASSIGTSAHGTRRMGTSSLESLLLPLPPPEEQEAMGEVLSKLQMAVETQGRIVATLKELKAATMAKLFREGLGEQRNGLRETRFGEVPTGWDILPLGEVAYIQTGIAKGRKLEGGVTTVEVPYLRVANVQDGYLDLAEIKTIGLRESEVGRYTLQVGDVLLTEGGDFDKLGRGYMWSGQVDGCVHQNHIFAVRTDRTRLLPDFFAYLAQSPYGKAYFLSVAHKTTNLASINSSKLKAFPVVMPPLDEQAKIGATLRKLDEALDSQTRWLDRLKSLFSSMLRQLMTGQLRVTRAHR
jgi:type I restriction enzyme S subunit